VRILVFRGQLVQGGQDALGLVLLSDQDEVSWRIWQEEDHGQWKDHEEHAESDGNPP